MSAVDVGQRDAQIQDQIQAQYTRPRHRWTVAEYHKLGEVGLLTEDAPVELIEGELIEMPPIGSEHAGQVNQLVTLFIHRLYGKAVVAGQNPVILGTHNEPQPDIAVLRWRDDYYKQTKPTPEDVLLLIEVSDTTARYDREVKVPLYARHSIRETWLLDLQQQRLEIYRQPEQGEYKQVEYRTDGQVTPEQLPEVVIPLTDLLPRP